MHTSKRTIIDLEAGDVIEVRAGVTSILVANDTDRHGGNKLGGDFPERLTIDFPQGAEMLLVPNVALEEEDHLLDRLREGLKDIPNDLLVDIEQSVGLMEKSLPKNSTLFI